MLISPKKDMPMKQLYLSLFLTITATTSCMKQELQRYQKYINHKANDTEEIPLAVFNPNPYGQSAHTNTPPNMMYNQQAYDQSIDPNWPKYNKIMDMSYQPQQPAVVTPVVISNDAITKLVPVFTQTVPKEIIDATKKTMKPNTRYAPHSSTEKKRTSETKTLLRTNKHIQPSNTELIQKIYNDAYYLILEIQCRKNIGWQINHNNKLVKLIDAINKARINGIDEDAMGKFAYEQQLSDEEAQKKFHYNKTEHQIRCYIYTTLFFSYLKRYTLTVNETGEPLPFTCKTQPCLADIFDTPPNESKKLDIYDILAFPLTSSTFKTHNAFAYLEYVLRNLAHLYSYLAAKHLTGYLHENNNQPAIKDLPKHCSHNLIYDQTYHFLLHNGSCEHLYEILTIIETAIKSKVIKNEIALGYDILSFTPTITILNFWNEQYDTPLTKSCIALLCALIKKYNNARGNKLTPTCIQYEAYALYKDLNLARPNSCKCAQLNRKHYAFVEFKQLLEDRRALIHADDTSVEQQIAKLYPLAKKVT